MCMEISTHIYTQKTNKKDLAYRIPKHKFCTWQHCPLISESWPLLINLSIVYVRDMVTLFTLCHICSTFTVRTLDHGLPVIRSTKRINPGQTGTRNLNTSASVIHALITPFAHNLQPHLKSQCKPCLSTIDPVITRC